MPEPSLEGCREKHARGTAYLERLTELIDEYANSNPPPHRVVAEFKAERRELVFTGEVLKPMEDLLLWGVVLGDGVHNLRSALDHLVWQLVLLDTGKDGSAENQFPICSSGGKYWSITTNGDPSIRDRLLKGINGDHRAIIDSVQPYRTYVPGKIEPLAALRDLSDYDKHRLVHTTLFAVDIKPSDDFWLNPNADAGEQVGEPKLAPFVEGEAVEIMTVKYSCPGPSPAVIVHGNLGIGIGFDPHRIRLTGFREMAQHVGNIIEMFAPDLP